MLLKQVVKEAYEWSAMQGNLNSADNGASDFRSPSRRTE